MRTLKLSNFQETLVVELETDAVSDNQDIVTIHDINTIKGDFERFVEKGFSFKVPDVIDRQIAAAVIGPLNINAIAIDPYTGHETIINAATDDFDFTTAAALTGGNEGVDYEEVIEAEGGLGPYTYALAESSTLPEGLVLSEDGVLSGTPTTADSYAFTIFAYDYLGQEIYLEFTLEISA